MPRSKFWLLHRKRLPVSPMARPRKAPVPGEALNLTFITLPAGTLLHRIHSSRFGATQYNPTGGGNARFSPIRNAAGQVVPTLYAGSTFHCAAMETVFHDVPYAPGFKTVQQRRFAGNLHSYVLLGSDLQLVDLSSKALRLLGVPRSQLIDTEADHYPCTRQWLRPFMRLPLTLRGCAGYRGRTMRPWRLSCSATEWPATTSRPRRPA